MTVEYQVLSFKHLLAPDALEEVLAEKANHGWQLASFDWNSQRKMILSRVVNPDAEKYLYLSKDQRLQLRMARQAKGWTQKRLARELGCSSATISNYESGFRPVSRLNYRELIKVLGKEWSND